ncbi:methylase involved in ubiquinone/menaquinone biosynthesis [Aequorivita sublithincola DSM 14238]|uniref:Methylase involved in ubiquinone/menaquinone biosynthesis n=1 Tax=Aequorivita sublithincola (strain DSM 14238 / LMG 21431 / ACAM 643 / 9-3) TaxID=746697 RepID=I3YRS4_AEQSU|nr:class I SAM-dependent methyltransferase [Aequorivita sublithincola]AFL79692.1 methylase involved in ubiquinone/menaquinone biosynthesis [Aequorivita sublithincola DSM 14238]
MNHSETFDLLGNVDIYVIDQILKGRYEHGQSILDAGCGTGRNLKWFYQNDFNIYGIDVDAQRIAVAKEIYPKASENFIVGELDNLPYEDHSFDHLLCCAVLHFAQSETHFNKMIAELFRVLKPSGTLLIRVASDIGLNDKKPFVQDGSSKEIAGFYITRSIISKISEEYPLALIEPVKTTNVQDIRVMTTLVFQKTL